MDDCGTYIISSCSCTPGAGRWARTCAASAGAGVRPVVVMFEPYFAVPEGIEVVQHCGPYPGHVKRYEPLLDLVARLGLDKWYVWTDCADVCFQGPLPDVAAVAGGANGIVCSESVLHGQTRFWQPFLRSPDFSFLADQPIYNVGTLAFRGTFLLSFIRYLLSYTGALQQYPWVLEQMVYNRWLYYHREQFVEAPSVFLALFASFTGRDIRNPAPQPGARVENGRFVNAEGVPFAVVHANGDSKKLLDAVWPPEPAKP